MKKKNRTGEAFEGDVRLTVAGGKLEVGDKAPDFSLEALGPGDAAPHEVTLASGEGRVRLLHVVNSLDTPVCHVGAHRFEQLRTAELPPNVDVYTVSMDLPYAQARWRGAPGHMSLAIRARAAVPVDLIASRLRHGRAGRRGDATGLG